MSLPRYIVNLEEAMTMFPDGGIGSGDAGVKYDAGYQRSKGLRFQSTEGGSISRTWTPLVDVDITGLKIGIPSHYKDQDKGSFSFLINGEPIARNVNLKNINEYKNFRVRYPVEKGSELEIVYHGNKQGNEIDFWIDIDHIGEPLLGRVMIRYTDESNNDLISPTLYDYSLGDYLAISPKIEGYLVTDAYFQSFSITEDDIGESKDIVFVYVKG